MERLNIALSVLVLVLIVAVAGLSSSYMNLQAEITGHATEQSTVSSAVIAKYVAIIMSGNLSDGIDFGSITSLPATDVNASLNYNSTVHPGQWANETLYWIEVDSDSNTNVDFCVRSTNFNTSGGAEIELGNYTWADNTTNEYDYPALTDATAITNSYDKGNADVAPGENNTYRFWLDVPAYIDPGTYNSTVWFKGVPYGDSC